MNSRLVVIRRQDFFQAQLTLGDLNTQRAGTLWCQIFVTDDEIHTLENNGIEVTL